MGNCKYQIDVCEIQIRVVKFQIKKIQIPILILCLPERSRRTRTVERTILIQHEILRLRSGGQTLRYLFCANLKSKI